MSVILDSTTGCYNATKTLDQLYKLHPTLVVKDIHEWFKSKDIKELIPVLVADKYQSQDPLYDISDDENDFNGIYMCSELYTLFLIWIDQTYGLSILLLIGVFRDRQIAQLTEERNVAQSALINVETSMNQLTNSTIVEREFDVNRIETDITFKIHRISELFAEKHIHCVVEPKQYICMAYEYPIDEGTKGMRVLHVAGQNVNAQEAVDKYTKDFAIRYPWKEIVSVAYYDNTNDFLHRIKTYIVKCRNDMLKKAKDANAAEVRNYNATLKEEIKQFNLSNPENKRIFNSEKRVAKKINAGDICIEASKYTSAYFENEFVSMDEYIDMLRAACSN